MKFFVSGKSVEGSMYGTLAKVFFCFVLFLFFFKKIPNLKTIGCFPDHNFDRHHVSSEIIVTWNDFFTVKLLNASTVLPLTWSIFLKKSANGINTQVHIHDPILKAKTNIKKESTKLNTL